MRRLFSTFASGWPGAGLLIMRLVAGLAIFIQGFMALRSGLPLHIAILQIVAIASGMLLVAGLWTPVSGTALAVLGVMNILARRGDLWANILLATLGGALALLGPGAWSADARIFGWKRIKVGDRRD